MAEELQELQNSLNEQKQQVQELVKNHEDINKKYLDGKVLEGEELDDLFLEIQNGYDECKNLIDFDIATVKKKAESTLEGSAKEKFICEIYQVKCDVYQCLNDYAFLMVNVLDDITDQLEKDADVKKEQEKRDKVIFALKKAYGQKILHIITFEVVAVFAIILLYFALGAKGYQVPENGTDMIKYVTVSVFVQSVFLANRIARSVFDENDQKNVLQKGFDALVERISGNSGGVANG